AGVLELAGGLAALGVCRGERVALWLPNCAHWVTMFLACARLGALTLAVNTRFRAQELGDILGRGQADWLVYWPGLKGIDFAGILAAVPPAARARLRGAIVVDGSGAQATP
ncbi:AMP-binding protein, partial [Bordetella pertussis]|uniref:AMP-binding protein n=1 Tax=Bordetella pertussis TaxID=520 RepID=UPI0012B29402